MEEQVQFFARKLAFTTDAYDVYMSLINKEKIVLLDVRSPEAYAQEHIPGALNFHHKLIDKDSISRLDSAYTYVTYCDGLGCNASTKGAYKLASLGIKVKELIGGLDWWKRDGYATGGTLKRDGIRCYCD